MSSLAKAFESETGGSCPLAPMEPAERVNPTGYLPWLRGLLYGMTTTTRLTTRMVLPNVVMYGTMFLAVPTATRRGTVAP